MCLCLFVCVCVCVEHSCISICTSIENTTDDMSLAQMAFETKQYLQAVRDPMQQYIRDAKNVKWGAKSSTVSNYESVAKWTGIGILAAAAVLIVIVRQHSPHTRVQHVSIMKWLF